MVYAFPWRTGDDDARSVRPSTTRTPENVGRVRDLSNKIVKLPSECQKSKTAYQDILHDDLSKRKLNSRLERRSLTHEQKKDRFAVCADSFETASKDDTFCSSIIAGNETWCLQYDPETKRQSAECRNTNLSASKKICAQSSKTKTKLNALFDCSGAVHKEFVPQGQSVNHDVYKGVLERLGNSIRRSVPELRATGKWFFLHDNERSHTTLSVKEFLWVHQITVLRMRHILQMSPYDSYFHKWTEH